MTFIEYLRKDKGMSQVQLSRELKINSTAIAQLEKGYRKSWPKLREQLSKILDVKEDVLFDEEGWPRKVHVDIPKIN
ncbi:helix-turn-helix domain-containing protein [Priestia megaterium]|uniref:helix-turn-helix domain-containing protein n=1 Tax=Priestia megaterium TaxID=1404 RepID=UPI00159BEC93|nr:helix-turn-helix transcriptional regulator [Priestia megaterium]